MIHEQKLKILKKSLEGATRGQSSVWKVNNEIFGSNLLPLCLVVSSTFTGWFQFQFHNRCISLLLIISERKIGKPFTMFTYFKEPHLFGDPFI